MRGIALSLATVGSLGIVLAGEGVIMADRIEHARWAYRPPLVPAIPAASPADRLWYGGTLAPIVVTASAPDRAAVRRTHNCSATGR